MRTFFRTLLLNLFLLAVYFAAGRLGLSLAQENASVSAVWPPSGIALAALLLFGFRVLPAILAGAFLVNFTITGRLESSLLIAGGNTIEAGLGALLVIKFARGAAF